MFVHVLFAFGTAIFVVGIIACVSFVFSKMRL